jgi:prepilin-type N-terminal cleavage/methylation domain-containing protein
MSDRTRRRRDAGMTLPELLIGVVVTGVLMAAMSVAVIVVVKQRASTGGRLNNATATQSINTWMQPDMASAETVDDTPSASPCGSSCPSNANVGGSNAVMFSWVNKIAGGTSSIDVTTNVSYRYVLVKGEYQLIRVECTKTGTGAWTCSTLVAARQLPAPPSGTPFVAGTTKPTWALALSTPTDPGSGNAGATTKTATRVVVNLDGGGTQTGLGGGSQQIVITGSSADKATIDADDLNGTPTITTARSRCGKKIGVIIDTSGSIGATAMGEVRTALKSFVDMFSGTPVQMQFVRFQTTATTIGGAGGRGQRYYDFLDPAEVTSAKSELDKLVSNGGTNWEDAWFQMFYDTNGKLEQVTPDLVLFFTDGVATLGRNLGNGYSSSAVSWNPPAAVSGAPKSTGNTFYWEGWYRTDLIADTFGATTRYIGVGVGPDVATGKKSSWWTGGNTSVQVENGSTIARLITADDNGTGVPATKGPAGTYDNAAVANMYLLPAWSQFADALKAVALAECGGTVTVQTQVDGVPAGDPVTYVRSNVTDALGKAVDVPLVSITTDQSSISATVDFSIPSGQYVTASIVPQNTGQLGAYTPGGWSCTSGGAAKSTTSVAIDGSTWQGVRLKVGANEAVSCILDLDLVTPP